MYGLVASERPGQGFQPATQILALDCESNPWPFGPQTDTLTQRLRQTGQGWELFTLKKSIFQSTWENGGKWVQKTPQNFDSSLPPPQANHAYLVTCACSATLVLCESDHVLYEVLVTALNPWPIYLSKLTGLQCVTAAAGVDYKLFTGYLDSVQFLSLKNKAVWMSLYVQAQTSVGLFLEGEFPDVDFLDGSVSSL